VGSKSGTDLLACHLTELSHRGAPKGSAPWFCSCSDLFAAPLPLVALALRAAAFSGSRHGFRPRSAGSIPPPPCSEERRLRLRFRWLSRMVHPDKCPLPRAAEAFQALASAMEWALKRASGDDVTEGPSGSPWPECSGDRRAGADGSPDAADAEEAADRAHLGLLSHEELCEVVRSRQQAVMAKLQNPAGICESLGKLQAALKSARTALSQKQHDTRSWEGCGFIPNL